MTKQAAQKKILSKNPKTSFNQVMKFINVVLIVSIFNLSSCVKHKDSLDAEKSFASSGKIAFKNFSSIDDGTATIPSFPYESWTLENGLKVYFVNDPELPVVSSSIFIPGGSFWEKSEERGLYAALGDNMRSGGAGKLSPQDLDREVEKYAASISSSFGQEFGSISSSSLSTDFEKIFSLMCEVLLRPTFNRERLSLWKGQSFEGIRRRVDDPTTVASLAVRQLLVGGTPYGSITLSQDITSITRPKLRALHVRAVIPNNAILAISGNISREQAGIVVQKYLAAWPKASSSLVPPPPFPDQKNSGIVFIEQPLAQATVLIGQLGPERFSSDQYATEIFNQHFGSGGFGSVLMKRIRTELGLAYGVYGSINPGLKKGRTLLHLQTKPESVGEAVAESLNSLEGMKQKEISQSDLIETRKSIANTFIFNFTSPSQVLGRKVQSDLIGYPPNYDQKYLENIRAVTAADIKEVANKRWNYNDFVLVLVGPKTALESLKTAQPRLPSPLNSAKIRMAGFDEVLKLRE